MLCKACCSPSLCVLHPIWVFFLGGGLPRGLGHNLHFSTLGNSKKEISKINFLCILGVQNDQLFHVQHVLAPPYVFFRPLVVNVHVVRPRPRALSTMGDKAGVATQLATLLQRPAVLTAKGAVLAAFLAGAPPATVNERAARSRSRSKGRKGGGGSAQQPAPPPLRSRR